MAQRLAAGVPIIDADALLEIAEAQIACAATIEEAIAVIRRIRRGLSWVMVETAIEGILAEADEEGGQPQ